MDLIKNMLVVDLETEFLHRYGFTESENSAYKLYKGHTITMVLVEDLEVLSFNVLEIKNGHHSP